MTAGFTADEDRTDIAAVLAGDRNRFAVLVDRHQRRLRAHLTRLVGAADAEDLAQDAFLRAYTALDRYDPTYPFRGWLLVIATRLAANHRERRHEQRFAADAPEPAGPCADPARTVAEADAADDLGRRLDRAVAELGDDARDLFELRFRQELEPAALASHLGISPGVLKTRLWRLRQQLATALNFDEAQGHQS